MSSAGQARSRALSIAPVYAAVAVAAALGHHAPSFTSLGPRGQVFGWLAYATASMVCLPGAVMVLGLRRPASSWGLTWGKSRRDALWIALGLVGAVALAWGVSRSPEVRAHYPHYGFVRDEPWLWIPSTLAFGAYGLSWEMAFRGALILGVTEERDAAGRRGLLAVLAQAALYAMAHAGKPSLEIGLSIPAGVFFGLVALRTRSVLPGFLVHFAISTSINLFCVYG